MKTKQKVESMGCCNCSEKFNLNLAKDNRACPRCQSRFITVIRYHKARAVTAVA